MRRQPEGNAMVIDPVCLKQLDERQAKLKSEFRGQIYYFDSDRCQHEFEGRPEDFAGKIAQITYGDQGRGGPGKSII